MWTFTTLHRCDSFFTAHILTLSTLLLKTLTTALSYSSKPHQYDSACTIYPDPETETAKLNSHLCFSSYDMSTTSRTNLSAHLILRH